MYNHPDPPNFKSFSSAARKGNPDSALAFNPGVKTPISSLTEEEDYTAGEIAGALPVSSKWTPINRFVGKAQFQILTFLGDTWGLGNPRFPDNLVIDYTRYINSFEGAITFDFPPPREDGNIPSPFYRQLKILGQNLK